MLPSGLPVWTGPAEPGHVHDIAASPRRTTEIVRAALVLTQFEHKYLN
jgi:hypothetical protein